MQYTKSNIFTIWPFIEKNFSDLCSRTPTSCLCWRSQPCNVLGKQNFLTLLRLCGRLNMATIFPMFFSLRGGSVSQPLGSGWALWLLCPIEYQGHAQSQCWDSGLEKLPVPSSCLLRYSMGALSCIPRKVTDLQGEAILGSPDMLICKLNTTKGPQLAPQRREWSSQALPTFPLHKICSIIKWLFF